MERTAIDGARRRRIYLFRHGAVDYIDRDGNWVTDPDNVDLNELGRAQAASMGKMFADVHIDRAICSGLPRTVQTASAVLGGRDIELEIFNAFEEIRPLAGEVEGDYDIFVDVAYSHWKAQDFSSTFLGGERYHDFYVRISAAMESLLMEPDWNNIAVFAHGGTNAAVLGWATGIGLDGFGLFDQATCCLNVVDFDVDESGTVVRKHLRGMNITADDPTKQERHAGDMESLAKKLLQMKAAG
jgi:broad specificity phosphatase PhoE